MELHKSAVARRIIRDSIAEEQRLLYVAMTRAREKLIITGVVKDVDKTLEKYRAKSQELVMNGRMSYAESENIKNYLDMIMPVCLMPEEELHGRFNVVAANNADEIRTQGQITEDVCAQDVTFSDVDKEIKREKLYPSLDELPEYIQDEAAAGRMKITVSELKAMQSESDSKEAAYMDDYDDLKDNVVVPRFITGEEKKLASNERGTAYHRVMECLDYSRSINIDGVKQDIQQMLDTGRMTRIQAESINPYDINTFVQSEIGQRVSKAVQSEIGRASCRERV